MKKGLCPKCGSREVYDGSGVSGKSGMNFSNTIPITSLSNAKLDNYVCFICGYVESYVASPKDLAKIEKKWPLVM
jgi:predicted nucleic-acid-binding Zn-ribbon protein